MRNSDRVSVHVIYRLAAAAHCSDRAVRRVLDGQRVLAVTSHAVSCACEALGLHELLPPHLAAEYTGRKK